jgi:hypothetical protein
LDAQSRVERADPAGTSHSAVTLIPDDWLIPLHYLAFDTAGDGAFAA